MARSTARAAAMQLIYERLLGGDGGDASIEMIYENLDNRSEQEPTKDDMQYITDVLAGVRSHEDEIDQIIERMSVDWTLDRMTKVDVTLLKLGIYELLYNEDIPASVAINEAVELANTYSDPNGSRFVNGILGAVERSLRKGS